MTNHFESYKIALINATAFLISFSSVEQTLKIILLLVSIIYTCFKIVELINKRNKKND